MKKHWVLSESAFPLDHNHPIETPSQKKLLAKLRFPREHVHMVLDLGNSFMTGPNIVEFMHERGYDNISAKHKHDVFEEHGCSSAYDAHELLTTLEKNRDIERW